MYGVRLFIIVFLVPLFMGLSITLLNAQKSEEPLLSVEIQKLSNDPIMKFGHLGVCMKSLKTGKTLVSEDALKNLSPASNLKLLTTAAALSILGENYTFKTLLEYDGIIKDSILYGSIYITGSGDPTLGSDRYKGFPSYEELFSIWAKKIKEAGIKNIKGAIVADPTIFDKSVIPDHWPWGDIGNYYGAGIFGININENLYRLYFKGFALGDSAQLIKTVPLLKGVNFLNEVKTGPAGSGDNAYVYGAPHSNFVYIRGTIPANSDQFAVRGAMPNPPLFCALSLSNVLGTKNVKTEKEPYVLLKKDPSALQRKLIYAYTSPVLREIVKQTNTYSLNLSAEVLLRASGYKKYGEGSTDAGIKAVQDFWKQKGMDTNGWFLYDGSGMSPNNGISASQLCNGLYLLSKDSVAFKTFYNSLPIAGQTGTVAKLCKGTAGDGNVRVKSGTLSKVICYSGYVTSKSGELFSFSIMANDFNCSNSVVISRLEKIMIKMAETP